MVNPNELLNRAAGFKYVSKIDLGMAYFQCFLSPNSRRYTGFQMFMGSFVYRKLPLGLKCASATFQRLVDKVLKGMHRFAGTLLDDTLIYSTTFPDHLDHVRQVLDRLGEAGLAAKKAKCHFASNRMRVFGHQLIDGLIYPDEDKVAVIAAWKPPKTKRELKSFLGMVSYFRDHLPRFAAIAYPLTESLGRTKPDKLIWTEDRLQAFETLRTALMSSPVLKPPYVTKPYLIMCDASRTAISAILMQPGDADNETEHVVCYASRKLSESERKFATIELELLAIIFALQKFRNIILGCPIKIFTDHRPLLWLDSLVKHSGRLARWALKLQEYDITTTYVKGRDQLADHLTCLP